MLIQIMLEILPVVEMAAVEVSQIRDSHHIFKRSTLSHELYS